MSDSTSTTLNIYCPAGKKAEVLAEAAAHDMKPGAYLLGLHDAHVKRSAKVSGEAVDAYTARILSEASKRAAEDAASRPAQTLTDAARENPAATRDKIMASLVLGDGSINKAKGDYERGDFLEAVRILKLGARLAKKWPSKWTEAA